MLHNKPGKCFNFNCITLNYLGLMAVKWDCTHSCLLQADWLKTSFGVSCEDRCSPTFLGTDTLSTNVLWPHKHRARSGFPYTMSNTSIGPGVKDIQNITQTIFCYTKTSNFTLPSQFQQTARREGDQTWDGKEGQQSCWNVLSILLTPKYSQTCKEL